MSTKGHHKYLSNVQIKGICHVWEKAVLDGGKAWGMSRSSERLSSSKEMKSLRKWKQSLLVVPFRRPGECNAPGARSTKVGVPLELDSGYRHIEF